MEEALLYSMVEAREARYGRDNGLKGLS